jgi:hypothetical protein
MAEEHDEAVGRALRAIPEDPDAPARIVTALASRRLGWSWAAGGLLAGGGALAAVAGFAMAYLQGPMDLFPQDAVMVFLGGAL